MFEESRSRKKISIRPNAERNRETKERKVTRERLRWLHLQKVGVRDELKLKRRKGK